MIAIVAVIACLQRARITSFAQSSCTTLGVLVFASVVLHVFIAASGRPGVLHISLAGHAWRLAAVTALASIASAAVAVIASRAASRRSA